MSYIDKTIDGRNFRIFYEQDRFIDEVIDQACYKQVIDDLQLSDEKITIIDLGANIGTFSFWIYDKANKIYAIEPSSANVENMEQTKKYSKLDNLYTFCIGISENGGEKYFSTASRPGMGGWKMDAFPVPCDDISFLPTKTIKQFMNGEGIETVDLLKIDIEGEEANIFSSPDFREVAPRIKNIIGEFHGYNPENDLDLCGYRVTIDQDRSNFNARRI